MATTTFSAAPSNASDANFRAWGSALSTALAAVGLVKTADTGQINWTTVLAPGAATTFIGGCTGWTSVTDRGRCKIHPGTEALVMSVTEPLAADGPRTDAASSHHGRSIPQWAL